MLANSQFLAVDQRPKKATVSTILLMHAVGVSVDQRHLFEARNISNFTETSNLRDRKNRGNRIHICLDI